MKKLESIFIVLIIIPNILISQVYWEIVNTPTDIYTHGFDINSNNDIFIGVAFSEGGGVMRKLNNNSNWDTSLYFNNNVIGNIFIDNLNKIYAASNDLFFSQDNGANWSLIYDGQVFGITSIYKISDSTIFIGKWGGIYKSDDYGENWVQVMTCPQAVEVVRDFALNEETGELFAGSTNYYDGGGVYHSTDGGDTWVHFGLYDHYVSSLAFNSSGDLFAGTRGHVYFGTGGVFMLPDDQSNWTTLNDEEIVTSLVVNSMDDIYISCSIIDFYSGGIRRSTDNGQTWENISNGMGDIEIEDLVLNDEGYLYALEYYAPTSIYKSINSTITGDQEHLKENISEVYNYPNPFIKETTIYIPHISDNNGEIKISIYNSVGEKIKDIVVSNSENQKKIRINLEGYVPGIYYYELYARNKYLVKKMILQKE